MRRFGFGLGVVAAAALVAQLLSYLAHSTYQPVSSHSIWSAAGPDGLARLQDLVENRLSSGAWAWVDWVLRLPVWLVAGLLALPFLLRGRRQRRGFD